MQSALVEKDGKKVGLQLELSDIYIHQNEDAEKGWLPGNVQLKATININTFSDAPDYNTAMAEVGSYFVTLEVDGKEVKTKEDFFIYGKEGDYTKPGISIQYYPNPDPNKPIDPDTNPDNGSTKWVSGLQYNSYAYMSLAVTGIKNTQPQVTKNLNRLNLSWNSNDATTSTALDTAPISKTNTYMSLANDTDTLSNAAEFSYNRDTKVTTSTDVGMFEKSVTAKLYGRDGSIVNDINASQTSNTATASRWLWTHTNGEESSSTITFNDDGSENWLRKLGAWDITNKGLIKDALSNKFMSNLEWSLIDTTSDYYNELLVQGGWLKHPKYDKTGTYSSQTNERCFVRRIQMPKINGESSHKQLGEFNIKINNFNSKHIISGGSSKVANTNIYLASKDTNRVMHLNSERNETTSSDTVASVYKAGSFNNSSWTVDCKSDVFSLYTDTDYYLIVTMTKDSEDLGAITISRVK